MFHYFKEHWDVITGQCKPLYTDFSILAAIDVLIFLLLEKKNIPNLWLLFNQIVYNKTD